MSPGDGSTELPEGNDPSILLHLLDDMITASVSVVRLVRVEPVGLSLKCLFPVTADFL